MEEKRVFESEYRFCEILWKNEPVSSGELVKLCSEELGWKKSTTYTVIKRLTERGVIQSVDAIVTSLVSREELEAEESCAVVEKRFQGSLPRFLAAFTKKQKLTGEEVEELQKLIDNYKG